MPWLSAMLSRKSFQMMATCKASGDARIAASSSGVNSTDDTFDDPDITPLLSALPPVTYARVLCVGLTDRAGSWLVPMLIQRGIDDWMRLYVALHECR